MKSFLSVSLGGGLMLHFYPDNGTNALELKIDTGKKTFTFFYDTYSREYHEFYNYIFDSRGELFLRDIPKPTIRIHRENENSEGD